MLDKILLIGPVPPPVGGVSIHLQRLKNTMEKYGYAMSFIDESPIRKLDIFNLRSLNLFRYIRLLYSADIVHIHSSINLFRILHMVICIIFSKQFIVTLHSWRVKGQFVKKLQIIFFSKAKNIICVNNQISKSIGLDNCKVMPAFLPPLMENEEELPHHIQSWIKENISLERKIIASNAYRLDTFESNDIYGVDMAIDLMEYLVHKLDLKVSFIFVVSTLNSNDKLFDKYKSEIIKRGLSDTMLLIHEKNLSFVKLIEQSDFTCRLTNTDGDALSIRESLFLNKPIVASDVTERPEGTVLFNTRDQLSLNTTFSKLIIGNVEHSDFKMNNTNIIDFYKLMYS
jgi:glycosyltransferase involved in cell wall biosynthesis